MKSFSNLTVGEYQELYRIHTSSDSEIEKSIDSLSILSGKPRWEVEEMDLAGFKQKAKEISVLFSTLPEAKPSSYLWVNKNLYRVCLNPRKITAGQYIDLQFFLEKRNNVENLHKLMACIIKRFWTGKYEGENHEEVSEGIKNCNFIKVHSTCGFFLRLWNLSIKATVPFLKQELVKRGMEKVVSPEVLQALMDGFTTLDQ